MNITFYGGVREVTGSMHLLASETDRILLDCGMFQGRRKESDRKNRTLPFDPKILTNIVLTHGHIDHSGRIPLVVKNNFKGRVICTRATMDACEFLLLDSAHIQESDAQYLNYKTLRTHLYGMKTSGNVKDISKRKMNVIKKMLKKDRHSLNTDVINAEIQKYRLEYIEPLYTIEEAQKSLNCFDGYPYKETITVGQNMTCTFYDAGHILGSAMCVIHAVENGHSYHIGYTGDIGRFNQPIIEDPTTLFEEKDRNLDLLIMESTYGTRHHGPIEDLKKRLKKIIIDTVERGGSLVIPAFAFGRTQEIVYILHELYDAHEVPRLPVYVDSPLATNLTRVFGEHLEVYDRQTHETFLENGKNPFAFSHLKFTSSVEESMALMREEKSHIVIASSGMCEAGRILHHLRYKIHNPKNTILIVGFMAENTLGRRIQDMGWEYEKSGRVGPPPMVKFLNKVYPLKAHVVRLRGFSAHADQGEMLHFLKHSNLRLKKIAIVHGEEKESISFADRLNSEGFSAFVPYVGEPVQIK
ncbi:MAG TPA: MBL fold metallo-hydrolase [Desulfobacterales bacterium]|nr:MBL fold metallo-hydrolase [Desulfobacterales bacterium]